MNTIKKTHTLKNYLSILGSLLSILGIGFVAVKIYQYSTQFNFSNLTFGLWVYLLFLAFVYGLSGLLLALAWRSLLAKYKIYILPRMAVNIYGLSQICKYVPGNIFHLMSRQALCGAAGLSAISVVKSGFLEYIYIILSAATFAIILLLITYSKLNVAIVIFCMSIFGLLYVQSKVSGKEAYFATICYLIFFLVFGLIYLSIFLCFFPSYEVSYELLCLIVSANVVAWLCGFLMPGSPAGLGVREVVLYAMLQQYIVISDLAMIILLGRAVTVSGDLIFYIGSATLRQKQVK